MFGVFIIIAAVLWNILWFLYFPLVIVKFLGSITFFGKPFKVAEEYARSTILSKENYILLGIFVIMATISNLVSTGDVLGVNGTPVDMETFRWSFSYFVFMLSTVIVGSILAYFIYKLQLFLVFFVAASFVVSFSPFEMGSIILWYFMYLILSIPAIIFGYMSRTYLSKPISNTVRSFFDNKTFLIPLEFVLVNLFTGSLIGVLLYNYISKRAVSEEFFAIIEFQLIFILSVSIASIMVYLQYRFDNSNLELPDMNGPGGSNLAT